MKLIKYLHIYNYLVDNDGLSRYDACVTIFKIRRLPEDLKQAVADVIDGRMPSIEYVNGPVTVTLDELMEKEGFSPIRAILMMDWIRREPAIAFRYMATERFVAPMEITEEKKDEVREALKRLQAKNESNLGFEADESGKDIEIEKP